jgi:hypothetical protein
MKLEADEVVVVDHEEKWNMVSIYWHPAVSIQIDLAEGDIFFSPLYCVLKDGDFHLYKFNFTFLVTRHKLIFITLS